MTAWGVGFALAAGITLSTGAKAAEAPAGSRFAGTQWQLRSIQSMDDAQGSTRIDEPQRFTLRFDADDQAQLRLDCNRGSARVELKPSADPTSGQLKFSAMASTQAQCPPPSLGERVARDLGAVRSYLLKDGRLYLSLMADGGIYEWAPVSVVGTALDPERRERAIAFAPGRSSTRLREHIQGHGYLDLTLPAAAGQRLRVALDASHRACSVNLLPPDSRGNAMAQGERSGNRFAARLPDDGVYTLRVALPRAAARRGERCRFGLSVKLDGRALAPVSAQIDALTPGTRFHARSTTACAPLDTTTRECEALVVRRGFDGTATVLLRWDDGRQRRILFVKGQAVASDAGRPMTVRREPDGWRVEFEGGERFMVPEALVMGG